MRTVLRHILFSYLAFLFVILHFTGIVFSDEEAKMVFLISLGLAAITLLIKPILKLISLPSSGIAHLILSFLVSVISFYGLDYFLSGFSIDAGKLVNLNFFIFSLNSSGLTIFWSYVLVSLIFTLVFNFLNWLSAGKQK